jgi:hypothetical protein
MPKKSPEATPETRRITPSVTINRGQNSAAIFQTMLVTLDFFVLIQIGTLNARWRIGFISAVLKNKMSELLVYDNPSPI